MENEKSIKVVLGLFSYGGLEEATLDSVLAELSFASQHGKQVLYHRISGDALIERSRSRALGKFLESEGDVMVMVDHDIQWRPGDLIHVAEQAVKENALVGGLYCKRAFGKGWSSRVPPSGGVEFGKPGLLETPALATGFMAIPRSLVLGMIDQLDITQDRWKESFATAIKSGDHELIANLQDLSIAPIADGAYRQIDFKYHDYFRCIRAPSGNEGVFQFLSEDWSFANRAIFCGYKSYISTYPLLVHHGQYGYTIPDGMDARDKQAHEELLSGKERNTTHPPTPNKGARRNKRKLRNKPSS